MLCFDLREDFFKVGATKLLLLHPIEIVGVSLRVRVVAHQKLANDLPVSAYVHCLGEMIASEILFKLEEQARGMLDSEFKAFLKVLKGREGDLEDGALLFIGE